MEKKKKEKREYSVFGNFVFSAKSLFKAGMATPIFRLILVFVSLGITVFAAYENKLLLDALDNGKGVDRVILSIAGIVGFYFFLQIMNNVVYMLYHIVWEKTWGRIYVRSLKPLYRADYDKLESPEYKNLYSQYTGYVRSSTLNEYNAVMELLSSVLSILVFGTMISMLHPLIAAGLVVMAVVHYFAKKPLVKIQHKMNIRLVANDRKFKYATAIATDFENAKEIRLYNMHGWVKSVTDDCIAEHRKVHSIIQWYTFFVGFCHNALHLLRDGFAYVYLILMFMNGELTPGDFVLYFTAITSFSTTLNNLTERFNEIHKYDLQVSEIRKTEKIESSRTRGEGIPVPHKDAEIEFRGVSFRYPNAKEDTIRGISFKIGAGERLAVVGINGAGKTTLVKLLCGLYLPTEGEILLNGHPVNEYNINEYYSVFSAVFQDINVLPLTIAENVACSIDKNKIDREKVHTALEYAGLWEKVSSLEKGMDTYFDKEVHAKAVDFSGGEKQKLALARAIYMDRPFLILDEPTSALDPIAENKMYLQFNEITKNNTALFISHRLASTRFCDRIIHMEKGKIIEYGTHDELMKMNGKYAEMFRIQSQYYNEEKDGETV